MKYNILIYTDKNIKYSAVEKANRVWTPIIFISNVVDKILDL